MKTRSEDDVTTASTCAVALVGGEHVSGVARADERAVNVATRLPAATVVDQTFINVFEMGQSSITAMQCIIYADFLFGLFRGFSHRSRTERLAAARIPGRTGTGNCRQC